MRLVLTAGRWVLLDWEFLALRRTEGDVELVVTHAGLEDAERAEPMDPDTIVFGFCVPEKEDEE